MSKEKWDAIVGNPPYQDSNRNDTAIYQHFFEISNLLSNYTSMVFLDGWLKASEKSSLYKIRSSHNLISVKTCKNLFPSAMGAANTTIVLSNSLIDNGGYVLMNNQRASLTEEIKSKLETISDTVYKKYGKITGKGGSGAGYFGVSTKVLEELTEKIEFNEKPSISIDELEAKSEVLIIAKNKFGRGGYTKWFIIPDSIVDAKKDDVDKYKVYGYLANYGSKGYVSGILKPREIVGRSRQILFISKSINNGHKECSNVISIFNTNLMTALFTEGINAIPNLSTATNPRTGRIGWESDWTDEDLKIIFKDILTDEDWQYIEKL